MKKGVSPVVATVLLIAVAVVVGIMISGWVRDWVAMQTQGTETCSINTNYVIDSATYNRSTTVLTVKITNKDSEELYAFGAVLDNGTDVFIFNSTNTSISTSPGISASNKLKQGQSAYIKINLSAHSTFAQTLTEVTITNDACSSITTDTTTISQVS